MQSRETRNGSSLAAMRWLALLVALLLAVIVLVWLTGRGGQPRYRSYRVEIELLPNLSLEADTSEDANSGVGFKWKFDY